LEDHELLDQLTFIKRKRTPPSITLLGMILHFNGLSYRQTRNILLLLDTEVSHTAIWSWIQNHAANLQDDLWQSDMPPWIVIYETGLKTSGGQLWVYATIDPMAPAVFGRLL
jgi:transposase-like protein